MKEEKIKQLQILVLILNTIRGLNKLHKYLCKQKKIIITGT